MEDLINYLTLLLKQAKADKDFLYNTPAEIDFYKGKISALIEIIEDFTEMEWQLSLSKQREYLNKFIE